MVEKRIYLVLAVIWMIVIFNFSHQPAIISADQSGNLVEVLCNIPIIGFVANNISQLEMADFLIRKAAHMFSYFVLAVLWFMYMYDNSKSVFNVSIYSFILTFVYACSDEFHQLFIQGRSGEIRDILVDSTGAIIGIAFIYIIMKIIAKNRADKYKECY